MADQKSVFGDQRIQDAKEKLAELLQERFGKMEMAFLEAQGMPPLPHPEALMAALSRMQSMILGMRKEVVIIGAVCKTMCLGLDDDQVDAVVEGAVLEIDRLYRTIEETSRPEDKPSIVTPSAIPPMNGQNGRFGMNGRGGPA